MKTVHTFVMMGKPGSGKSTQAELLARVYQCKVFSAGRTFRSIATRDTFVGRKVKSFIDVGKLMPSWFASYLFEKELIELEYDASIVFEGIARTEPESGFFDEVMTFFERPYTVFNISIPDEVAMERLLSRAERADDVKSVIPDRLREYGLHTAPSIENFRSKGKVVDIDGTASVEEIHKVILQKLEELT